MWAAVIFPMVISTALATSDDGMRECTEGTLDATIAGCSRVIDRKPDKSVLAVALANRAQAFQRKGQTESAIADLSAAVATDPSWAYLFRQRGAAYARAGAMDKARADINASLILDPENVSANFLSCQLYVQQHEYDKAIRDCTRTVDIDPRLGKGYFFRSQSFWAKNDLKSASRDMLIVVLMDRSDAQSYAMLGEYYIGLGDQKRALEALDSAIELAPGLLYSRLARGKINQALGAKEKAEADYRAVLAVPAADDFGRQQQREALDRLTEVTAQGGPPVSPSPAEPTSAVPEDKDNKKSMCRFGDAELRRKLECDAP